MTPGKSYNILRSEIDQLLIRKIGISGFPATLVEPIKYIFVNKGKKVRAILLAESCALFGIHYTKILQIALALECIHTYSLIHDDLPAMDDDDYRRGKLSCHKKFDEATAILAGDAIQPLALEVLTTIKDKNLKPETKLLIINLFAKACGPKGMVEGQNRDLQSENKKINLKELDQIHYLKTGKLIEACVESICLLKKDLPKNHKKSFLEFAKKFGLAFQIKDDILDIMGDETKLGKPIKSDLKNNKSSYPSILGLEKSEKRARNLCDEALKILESLPYNTNKLIRLSEFIIERDN